MDWCDGDFPRRILEEVRRELQRDNPRFYAVFDDFRRCARISFPREGEDGEKIQVHPPWGFYTRVSRMLAISPNAVKYRLRRSLNWFVMRVRERLNQEPDDDADDNDDDKPDDDPGP